jgi:hypothetical protein
MADLIEELRERAARLPADGVPVVQRAYQRGMEAVDILAAALHVDPTLADGDRCRRDIDLLQELLRQMRSLARQTEDEVARHRLAADPATAHQAGRLGRTNPNAPDELDALSRRTVEVAQRVAGAALPDWRTPQRVRERSARLLPSAHVLEEIADDLRGAVKPALDLSHPDPEAVRLAALADQIADTARARPRRCAGPGCDLVLEPSATGRPRRYCGATCRQRARRLQLRYAAAAGPGERARPARDLDAVFAALPADTRPSRFGHDWDDTSVRLLREDGWWSLHGPAVSLAVAGFGPHGTIAAHDVDEAQRAAAAAVTTLTGRQVLDWAPEQHGQTVLDTSSWHARLGPAPSWRPSSVQDTTPRHAPG